MKKILLLCIVFIIPISVFADSGKSTIVMDVDSGRVLYEKNVNSKQLIASTTKIMTCIIILENSNLESSITVGDEVLSMYGTNIYIEKGEILKVKDLLYGLMLRSGNDAAVTLAVNTLGYDEFINKMNEKAKQIGMNNTLFNNPHGLDEDTKNYSTAYDMALLAKYAYHNQTYRKIISTKKYTTKSSIKSYVWYNRMSLINNYKNCVGGKNGYTPKAGKSLVSYAKNNDLNLMIVSLDDPSIYDNHKTLYNEYFSKFENYTLVEKGSFMVNGDEYYTNKTFKYPLTESEIDAISILIKIDFESDEKRAGEIEIKLNDEVIGKIEVYKKLKIKKEKKSLLKKFWNLFS